MPEPMAEHLASIYGTEKDHVNCPFYFKIGACRHGDRCSRLHNRPTISPTLLLSNMYQRSDMITPGVDPQGQPIDPRKIQEHFEDFYEDIYEELIKYGEIENLNICDNLADHMVGNIYVQFREEEQAEAALRSLQGRYYYYFIRLMGRKVSHVALECTLQSHPNMMLLLPESDESAQLSQIEMEKLLAFMVESEINKRMVLGHICYHVLAASLNDYMATVTNLKNPVNKWKCSAAPISAMMSVKRSSHGPRAVSIGRPSIHPATVDLKGRTYELLRDNGMKFLTEDDYRNPGPLQFDGPGSDEKSITLCVEDQDYMGRIKELQEYLDKVKSMVKPGCSQSVLKVALSSMASVTYVLSVLTAPSSSGYSYL